MNFTVLPSHLHAFAESANFIIKNRYGLPDGIVEQAIQSDIPLQPTLHWKTKTHYIACEVAERPYPEAIKRQFTDIVASAQPIQIIVAYPKDNTLSAKDYRTDITTAKALGIGFIAVELDKKGDFEYPGVSIPLRIEPLDMKNFTPKLRPLVADAYHTYMLNGDPKTGLQKLGQIVEDILYNSASRAKKKGHFTYNKFKPPKYINQKKLIDEMINEAVLDIPILGRCQDFREARNGVSHKPKSKAEAVRIEKKLKENFIIGTRILEDLPGKVKEKGYRLKI